MRRIARNDSSLDLLLDTMCNAFGGIVLIAILVALLIEKPGRDEETPFGNEADSERLLELEQEWTTLRTRLDETESQAEQLGEILALLRRRNELAATVSEKAETGAAALEKLAEQLSTAQHEKAEAESRAAQLRTELAALESENDTLSRQLERLENQRRDLVAANRQELRPPVLGSNPGKPFNIIYRHGRVFPLQSFKRSSDGGIAEVRFNESMIEVRNGEARPIPGHGLDIVADREVLLGLLKGLETTNRINRNDPAGQVYITNLVYEDSFEVFLAMEDLIRQTPGVESGWEPFADEDSLRFGPSGAKFGTQR